MTIDPHAPVRLGIVGAGGIAIGRHLGSLLERPDAALLTAACDVREEAITRVRETVPEVHGFSTVADMIAADVIDVALVATPHALHATQGMELLEAGIPVLIEKPVTCTLDELRELRAVQRRSGVPALVGQTLRYGRGFRWAKARMDADPVLVGPLRTFTLESLQDFGGWFGGGGRTHWLLDKRIAGGGATISLAIHLIDLVRYLSGSDYARVVAFARFDEPFIAGAESHLTASFEMTNGGIGTLHTSYAARRAPVGEAISYLGESGTLQHAHHWDDVERLPRIASSHGRLPTEAPASSSDWTEVEPPEGQEQLSPSGFTNQLVHFADVVRGTADPLTSLEENFNTVACVESLLESAHTGRIVDVPTS
jgi:predicted dehydrogenase